MKAANIKWDVDNREDLELLPTEIEIPKNIIPEGIDEEDLEDYMDDVDDYISDMTGFCHCGYDLVN